MGPSSRVTLLLVEVKEDRLQKVGLDRGPEAGAERWGRQEARAPGSGELGPQESLDSGVDVPSCGNQGLEVGLTVDKAHGVELLQLLLKSHFRHRHLEEAGLG